MSSSLKTEGKSLHDLHRSMVIVYVGPEEYQFHIHQGLLRQHSSFEKTFHDSLKEGVVGSIYLEKDGVDEIKLFEEWLYSGKFSYPKDSDNPSLVLVKVFCFAEKYKISTLQNATLDAIRDRATEQRGSLSTPHATSETYTEPHDPFWSAPQQLFGRQKYQPILISPDFEEPVAKYHPPATASAIHYAYEKTSVRSPLRRLLTDIFAYDVKPEALYEEDSLPFPAQFMADVLFTIKKRLPLRLKGEEADFDKNADKYHVEDSLCTPSDRKQRTSEDVEVRGTKYDFDSCNEPAAEADVPEPEPPAEAVTVSKEKTVGFEEYILSVKKKGKKAKLSKRDIKAEPKSELLD